MKSRFSIKNIAYLFPAMFFVLDRIIKSALSHDLWPANIRIFGDWFKLSLAANPYIAFSLPLNLKLILILDTAITLLVVFYTLYLVIKKSSSLTELLSLCFLSLGAISNLLDRFRFGYVIDYLDLRYFTVFNLADAMIVISIAYLVFRTIFPARSLSRPT